MIGTFTLVLLATTALAFDPREIFPCSFSSMTYTSVTSGGTELTSSIDALYHDHDNLWRWDSEFKGMPGFFDGHEWSVIWRPDDGASYHDFTLEGKCYKNNGGSRMYPYPYEWVLSKTDGFTWTSKDTTYNGQSVTQYTGVTSSRTYKFQATVNLFLAKKDGALVFGNGTVESSLIDVQFTISVSKFVTHTSLPGSTFVPSARCPPTTMPADASKEFREYCYARTNPSGSNGASFMKPSLVFFLATLLMTILIIVSM